MTYWFGRNRCVFLHVSAWQEWGLVTSLGIGNQPEVIVALSQVIDPCFRS
jgi:hypothetical protein